MANLTYFSQLDSAYKAFYETKINEIGGEDPYEGQNYKEDVDLWPNITYFDIVNYLVYSTNNVTQEQMKAYKSLEAHNYFTSGWVHNKILVKVLSSGLTVFKGEVSHSQSLNKNRLRVWIATKSTGEIITAHCTCMAGRGEACSHVGALLFAIEASIRMRNEATCTEKKNVWLQPNTKNATNKKVKDIDFSSSNMKRKKIFRAESDKRIKKSTSQPSESEVAIFFKKIAESGQNSAILSILPEYASKVKKDNIYLKSFYNVQAIKMNFSELIDYCKKLFMSGELKISSDKMKEIEKQTTKQSKSTKWYDCRARRITASNMKAVCQTTIKCPSLSLIKRICYPLSHKFTSAATSWGCSHEEIACKTYLNKMTSHSNFNFEKCGLHIHPQYSHIGATPDGKISCLCCGNGIVEIKCPYCAKNVDVSKLTEIKSSCLQMDEIGNVSLKHDHAYFYQVQTQIFVCNSDFCDFVVWTEKDIHIERIYPNEIFWEEIEEKCSKFFIHAILPEIVAQHYTKQKSL